MVGDETYPTPFVLGRSGFGAVGGQNGGMVFPRIGTCEHPELRSGDRIELVRE